MSWQVEQNTGSNNYVIRCVHFNGDIFAFTRNAGVWRRDGIGPWTQTFAGMGAAWVWNGQMWCGEGGWPTRPWRIWRSADGVNWTFDFDLTTLGSGQGSWEDTFVIGGYGDYLYVANHDVGGAGATYFYRRDLAGNWIHHSTHAGAEGVIGRGVVGFGNYIYWTNSSRVRRWNGATWEPEPTLDGNCGSESYLSVIGGRLYVGAGTIYAHGGGYYHKLPAAGWRFLPHEAPDNTWFVSPLCLAGDGEIYTLLTDGTVVRIYRLDGSAFHLVSYQDTTGLALGVTTGVGAEEDGTMYWGTRAAGTVRFFAYVSDYAISPVGNGLSPQAMDIDGDGDALYICVYNAAGQPVLVRVPLPLAPTAMGSTVFDPADGDAINVKCDDVGGHVAVSGNFAAAGNEQVEVSDDAGLTWTDIDRDAWGVERAQPILVSPDDLLNEVMVALETAQDITETFDGGATAWIVNNPGVGYSPSAMAKLPGGDELVIGDAHAVRKVEYSPNRGVTLQDITGGAAIGNVVALEVA